MIVYMSGTKHHEVDEEELKFYGYEKCEDYCVTYCHYYHGYKYCDKCAFCKARKEKRLMDTEKEKWFEEYQGCCGTCHYYTKEEKGYSCMCMDSPFAADWVEPDDDCSHYTMTRKVR